MFPNNKGKPIEPKGPWVDWYGEMARKTVLRRHSKVLPMSGDIFETIDRDREEELRAEGAARLLDTEPDAPVALPTSEELGEEIDEETGEVTDTKEEAEPAKDPATGEEKAVCVDGQKNVLTDDLCRQQGITAPILSEVHAILYAGKKPADALMALMTRELKRETHSPLPEK